MVIIPFLYNLRVLCCLIGGIDFFALPRLPCLVPWRPQRNAAKTTTAMMSSGGDEKLGHSAASSSEADRALFTIGTPMSASTVSNAIKNTRDSTDNQPNAC